MSAVADDDAQFRIRRTWSIAAAIPDRTANVFYGNLFRADPASKDLFKGDMRTQGRKLTQTLGFIVDHLDDADALVPAAQDLARRHLDYGVTEEQYGNVGGALLLTLKQLLGADFSAEDEAAWISVYDTLSEVMVQAAYR